MVMFCRRGSWTAPQSSLCWSGWGIWTELWWDRNGAKETNLSLSSQPATLFIWRGRGFKASAVMWHWWMPVFSHVMLCFRWLSRDKVRCRAELSWINSWSTLSTFLHVVAPVPALPCWEHSNSNEWAIQYALQMHFVYLVQLLWRMKSSDIPKCLKPEIDYNNMTV